MGIFARPRATGTDVPWRLYGGNEDLEVVGESAHQDELWALCGATPGDRVRHDVVAVLVPEPHNPHDGNAICVRVDGHVIGYLPRDVAARYVAGLGALRSASGKDVALRGVIVGGGHRNDGLGRLGVWLSHDPADFGLAGARRVPGRPTTGGELRTGFSDAWQTDIEDDSYDLSWFTDLPTADRPAIAALRALLAGERDPIDRHFQFAELERRLYRARDLYDTALDEFDEACARHDADMDTIRAAFIGKWGKVPLLETYRQMAIRKQKQHDWHACVRWCDRGLAVYGDDAAREEAVEDLIKRRNRALAKLDGQPQ